MVVIYCHLERDSEYFPQRRLPRSTAPKCLEIKKEPGVLITGNTVTRCIKHGTLHI